MSFTLSRKPLRRSRRVSSKLNSGQHLSINARITELKINKIKSTQENLLLAESKFRLLSRLARPKIVGRSSTLQIKYSLDKQRNLHNIL